MRKGLLIFMVMLSSAVMAQKGVTTFGIQVKPLIPNSYFNFSDETKTSVDGSLSSNWAPRASLNFGMVIRKGLSKAISVETGINLVRRNYTVESVDQGLGINNDIKFSFTGYEIPIQGLIYVRLDERWWMNGSAGVSIDMYPSNTFASKSEFQDGTFYDFSVRTVKSSWLQLAIQANYGFEFRSKDSGYFYLGASYHRPFSDFASSEVTYEYDLERIITFNRLSGTYFTLDFRYFFNEKPER